MTRIAPEISAIPETLDRDQETLQLLSWAAALVERLYTYQTPAALAVGSFPLLTQDYIELDHGAARLRAHLSNLGQKEAGATCQTAPAQNCQPDQANQA